MWTFQQECFVSVTEIVLLLLCLLKQLHLFVVKDVKMECILVGYMIEALEPGRDSLQVLKGFMNSVAYTSVFKSSPHIRKHGRCRCNCSGSRRFYPPRMSWQCVGCGGTQMASFRTEVMVRWGGDCDQVGRLPVQICPGNSVWEVSSCHAGMTLGPSFSKIVMWGSSSMSRYIVLVTEQSAKKQGQAVRVFVGTGHERDWSGDCPVSACK
jgi:hypothetical protein